MARALAEIEQDILALTEEERLQLLQKLIGELDAPSDVGAEAAWLEESERRLGEIEGGIAETFSAGDVLEEARKSLK